MPKTAGTDALPPRSKNRRPYIFIDPPALSDPAERTASCALLEHRVRRHVRTTAASASGGVTECPRHHAPTCRSERARPGRRAFVGHAPFGSRATHKRGKLRTCGPTSQLARRNRCQPGSGYSARAPAAAPGQRPTGGSVRVLRLWAAGVRAEASAQERRFEGALRDGDRRVLGQRGIGQRHRPTQARPTGASGMPPKGSSPAFADERFRGDGHQRYAGGDTVTRTSGRLGCVMPRCSADLSASCSGLCARGRWDLPCSGRVA